MLYGKHILELLEGLEGYVFAGFLSKVMCMQDHRRGLSWGLQMHYGFSVAY